MIVNYRDVSAAGDAEYYARVRNGTGGYYDFTGGTFSGTLNTNCKQFLTEVSDGDPTNSLYICSFTPPTGGPWPLEVAQDSDGVVPAYGYTEEFGAYIDGTNTELASIPSTTDSMRKMIQFLFEYFRNKKIVTTSTEILYKEDASTALGTAAVSDNGTSFTKGEMG